MPATNTERSPHILLCGAFLAHHNGESAAALPDMRPPAQTSARTRRVSCVVLSFIVAAVFGASTTAFSQQDPAPAAPQPPATEPQPATEQQPTTPPQRGTNQTPAAEPEPPPLPTRDEMMQRIPTAAELLHNDPTDWIVLKDNRVLVVQPVYPRPNTLAQLKQQIEELARRARTAPEAERQQLAKEREDLAYLSIELPGQEDRQEYRLSTSQVEEIIFHEDLMLLRADALIAEGKLSDAFELIFQMERTVPDWPGLVDRRLKLVFAEAQARLAAGEPETALVYLQQIDEQDPKYPGLEELLGNTFDALIRAAVQDDDFKRARYFLQRLTAKKPRHSVVTTWTNNLLAQANELIAQARDASAAGRHDEAAARVEKAAVVWPATPALAEAFRRYAGRFQRLKVGVLDLAGDQTPYFVPTEADRRHDLLTRVRLFELDSVDKTAHYRTPFFELWEPTDLGRKTLFTLRQSRAYWECHPVVTAAAVVDCLAARIDPTHPLYDERFDSYVDSLEVVSPFEFQVKFARVPLNLEPLFAIPLVRRTVSAGQPSDEPDLLSPRFVPVERTADRAVYNRARPEPDGVPQYHVAQVVETRYRSTEQAIRGLLRGEVSVLPHISPADVPRFQSDDRFFLQKYAVPVTHVLQFNRRSEMFANREIRRALMYAINRPRILAETILKQAGPDLGRVVSGPFPTESSAYNPVVPPLEFDLSLASTLAFAAKKQINKDFGELKLVCAPDPVARAAAREIIADWQRIGIRARILAADEAPAEGSATDWDILYRTVRLTDPVVQMWPLLANGSRPNVESLAHLPDWLRQEIYNLETAGDWGSAIAQLQQLHAQLWTEAQIVPLWELDDYMVVRKNIRGVPQRPVHTYQEIERWVVQPWYPTEIE